MKITKLENQRRNPKKFNLYIDGNYVSGITLNTVSDFDLFEGKEVDRAILVNIAKENELEQAISKIFDYYSRRLHSEKEIRTKLRGKFTSNVINEAVNKFKELGYIDDKRFAEAWVESRKKTKGKTVLKIELKQKGIAEDTIIELLEEIEPEDEYQRALALVEKKHWPEMNKEERYTKVGGFLARKGFNYDVIRQILKETETKNLPE